MNDSNNNIESNITNIVGTIAFLLAFTIILLQLDSVARIILSPKKLYTKRRKDQNYLYEQSIAHTILKVRQHVNEGGIYDSDVERRITKVISSKSEIKELINDLMMMMVGNQQEKHSSFPLIVGIALDLDTHVGQDWYIYLAFPEGHSRDGKIRYAKRIQTPLIPFVSAFREAMEKYNARQDCKKISFCFVADASSGLGINIIANIIAQTNVKGLKLVQEPGWMITIAYLMEKQMFSQSEFNSIIFSLVYLSALGPNQYSSSTTTTETSNNHCTTTLLTLPGQACTYIILPTLQKMFPNEKQIFMYDDCIHSVHRALKLKDRKHQSTHQHRDVTCMPQYITSSTPLVSTSSDKPTVCHFLSKLPYYQAGVVESWISSINTFLYLKNNSDDNNESEYKPFISKVGDLFCTEEDNSNMALQKLLEYIIVMNSESYKGPTLNNQFYDAAKSILHDFQMDEGLNRNNCPRFANKEEMSNIENCLSEYECIIKGLVSKFK